MTLKKLSLADGSKNQEKEPFVQEKKGKNIKVFWADVLENMKRRNWVFWLSFLTFFCYFPGYLVLTIHSIRSTYEGADAQGLLRMQQRLDEMMESLFLLNSGLPILILGLAILIGMQGFVYLHNKKQVDFYHSQPVTRKRRFGVLWFNGIAIFVITYLVNMLLGMAVATAFGCMSGAIFTKAMETFFLYFLFFVGIYHISILAVLLTGNTLVSLLAMGVLLGYELALRAMMVCMASSFYMTFGTGEEERIFDTLFSPIVNLYKYIILGGQEYTYTQYVNQEYTYSKTAVSLLILAVLFGVISFVLYQRRASESHVSSISFPKIKEALRFALLLLVGSFGILLIYYVTGKSIWIGLAGAVFFVALAHAVIQLIYEVDFRAIRKKWLTAAISLVMVLLVFFGFKYDWLGYDKRVPKQSQVESVYLSFIAEGFMNHNYVLRDGTEIYHPNYVRKNMKITDLDTIYELLEHREPITMNTNQFDGSYETMEFIFRFKNGKFQSRRFYFNYEENLGLIDEIYHMEEYQLANNQILEDGFVENYRIISANYNNGVSEEVIASVDMNALVEAYKTDVKNGSYTEVYYNYPIGKLTLLGVGLKNEEYRNRWELAVYDSYQNTIRLLQEAGAVCYDVFEEDYFGSIEKIEVTYVDDTRSEIGMTWEECVKTAIYDNPEMFDEILQDAVPGSNRWWSQNNIQHDHGYGIYIYTKNPYQKGDYYSHDVFFQTGEMPKFLLEDLEKIEFGEEKIITE